MPTPPPTGPPAPVDPALVAKAVAAIYRTPVPVEEDQAVQVAHAVLHAVAGDLHAAGTQQALAVVESLSTRINEETSDSITVEKGHYVNGYEQALDDLAGAIEAL